MCRKATPTPRLAALRSIVFQTPIWGQKSEDQGELQAFGCLMASPIRLYLDEDAQRTTLIRALRARQIDVMTASEAGNMGVSDAEQRVFAASQGRTVFTFNRGDFAKLHAE